MGTPWYWHLVVDTAAVGTHPTGMHSCNRFFSGPQNKKTKRKICEIQKLTRWKYMKFITIIVTLPSLEPVMSRTSVQHCTAKSRLRLVGNTTLHSTPFSWEPVILINKIPQVTSQPIPRSGKPTLLAIESTMSYHPRLPCFSVHMSQHFRHQMLWLYRVSNPWPLTYQSNILPLSQKSKLWLGATPHYTINSICNLHFLTCTRPKIMHQGYVDNLTIRVE